MKCALWSLKRLVCHLDLVSGYLFLFRGWIVPTRPRFWRPHRPRRRLRWRLSRKALGNVDIRRWNRRRRLLDRRKCSLGRRRASVGINGRGGHDPRRWRRWRPYRGRRNRRWSCRGCRCRRRLVIGLVLGGVPQSAGLAHHAHPGVHLLSRVHGQEVNARSGVDAEHKVVVAFFVN